MNNCSEFEFLLSLQLDGMLQEAEASALEEHLAQCLSCRSLQAELARLHADLAACVIAPPPGLPEAVAARIQAEARPGAEPSPTANPFRRYRSFWASAAVFALLIGAVAFGPGMLRGGNELAAPLMANEAVMPPGMESVAEPEAPNGEAGADRIVPFAAVPGEDANDYYSAVTEDVNTTAEGTDTPSDATRIAMGLKEQLPPEGEDALELLRAHLEADAAAYVGIDYQGFDEARGIYLFLVSYPDQTQCTYEIAPQSGGILRLEYAS